MLKQLLIKAAILLGIIAPASEIPPNPPVSLEVAPITALEANSAVIADLSQETPIIAATSELCSCVAYSRHNSVFQPPKVKQASDIPAIRFAPKVGGWALMDIPPWGHTAVVTKIIGTSSIEIIEANYPEPCEENRRIIPIEHPTIRGYFWYD